MFTATTTTTFTTHVSTTPINNGDDNKIEASDWRKRLLFCLMGLMQITAIALLTYELNYLPPSAPVAQQFQ